MPTENRGAKPLCEELLAAHDCPRTVALCPDSGWKGQTPGDNGRVFADCHDYMRMAA